MIKEITEKEYKKRDRNYFLMFLFGNVFFVLSTFSFFGSFPSIFCLGIYGLLIVIIGLVSKIELNDQRNHPENYNYCKKCKKIIKNKHIFCSICRQNIEREIRKQDSKKYIKEYKKFYKEKKK